MVALSKGTNPTQNAQRIKKNQLSNSGNENQFHSPELFFMSKVSHLNHIFMVCREQLIFFAKVQGR